MTDPNTPPPRPSQSGAANRRADAERRQSGGADRRDRGSDRRGQMQVSGERRAAPAAPRRVPWLEANAARLRWTTWMALAVIALRLIVPRPDGWRRWSDADAALADVAAARTSALLYYQSGTREWPAPGRPGIAPSAMLPYLSGATSYSRARYKLQWEYAADTLSGARVIGISVIGDDPLLAGTMARRAPEGMPYLVSGRRFIALIASAAGR